MKLAIMISLMIDLYKYHEYGSKEDVHTFFCGILSVDDTVFQSLFYE